MKNAIVALVSEKLFSDETREKVIKELNSNINVPIISEQTEEKVIRALWNCVEEVLKKVLLKD